MIELLAILLLTAAVTVLLTSLAVAGCWGSSVPGREEGAQSRGVATAAEIEEKNYGKGSLPWS